MNAVAPSTVTRRGQGSSRAFATAAAPERAFLVGARVHGAPELWPVEESLTELTQLVESAGAEVVGSAWQRLDRVHPATFIGRGKVEEVAAQRGDLGYTMVVFDEELSASQQRNLERVLGVKVLDRPAVILDIFAQRARSREGRLQVELAQLQYHLPRLAGLWQHLERLGGGIGTRGPGETQLETDRRLVRERIARLQLDLEEVRRQRGLYRRRRRQTEIPIVALVGYTNAGKSTLFNALTGASVSVEARPFATLDPTARRFLLPSGEPVLLLDTVGFIHKLPPTLVAAFHATLEELEEADLLVHVVDITHARAAEEEKVVRDILEELGLEETPWLLALNKVDLLPDFERLSGRVRGGRLARAGLTARGRVLDPSAPSFRYRKDAADREGYPPSTGSGQALEWRPSPGRAIPISALTGWGLDRLRRAVSKQLAALRPSRTGRTPRRLVVSESGSPGRGLARQVVAQ